MWILILSFSVVLLDQGTKYLVLCRLPLGLDVPVVVGWMSFRHIRNTGAAWGMLAGANHWLIVLSVVMLAAIVAFRRHLGSDVPSTRTALGCMIAGIVGNLIDRVKLGYVIDFLDLHWRGHHFPAFNVADAAICTGVGLYILMQVVMRRAEEPGVVSESG